MKRVSFAVLAVAAALSGCATTDTQDSSSPTPGAAATPGTSKSGGPTLGTAQPPVTGSGGVRGGSGKVQPELKRSVYYEFDKFDVKPEFRALVETNARWLKENPKARLTIEGNADEQGSREYNLALGQKRAESVTRMLVLLGAKPEQIEAVSFGEERPRASGHDEKSWSENRRSDFAAR